MFITPAWETTNQKLLILTDKLVSNNDDCLKLLEITMLASVLKIYKKRQESIDAYHLFSK